MHDLTDMVKKPKKTRSLEGRNEMIYLTTHSTHFIYGYMASATFFVIQTVENQFEGGKQTEWELICNACSLVIANSS